MARVDNAVVVILEHFRGPHVSWTTAVVVARPALEDRRAQPAAGWHAPRWPTRIRFVVDGRDGAEVLGSDAADLQALVDATDARTRARLPLWMLCDAPRNAAQPPMHAGVIT